LYEKQVYGLLEKTLDFAHKKRIAVFSYKNRACCGNIIFGGIHYKNYIIEFYATTGRKGEVKSERANR
jgi:hypothetical protein